MSTLTWDGIGNRFYETGLDQGVLYLSDNSGIPWNGLVEVTEEYPSYEAKPYYLDGVKYNDDVPFTDFAGTLTALTYPDEFANYEGIFEIDNGVYVENQSPKQFGLSYRTKVGNDTDGDDHGYQIHVLYNLTAIVSDTEYSTLADSTTPVAFSWALSTTPQIIDGYRSTAHIIFDSRYLDPDIFRSVEHLLHGSSAINANLPTINDFLTIIENWDPKIITPNTATGLAPLTSGIGDLTQSATPGLYFALADTRLRPTGTPGLFTYV